jgi:molybdopterin/thiamine biosynthesis adenylyltransferase/predicted sulfurtransferase
MMKKDEWLSKLRSEIKEVSPEEVQGLLEGAEPAGGSREVTVVDVREPEEYRQGHVPGAVHLPKGFLEIEAEKKLSGRRGTIVAYCAGGFRSLFAAEALRKLGFSDVLSMAGGFTRWKQNGHPVDVPGRDVTRESGSDGDPEGRELPAATREELKNLRGRVKELPPEEALRSLENGKGAVFLDVRQADEYRQGHIPGALHLSRGFLEVQGEQKLFDRRKSIIVYSTRDIRSLLATGTLMRMGFENVSFLSGGLKVWQEHGYPLEVPEGLTDRERERYLRHITMDEVGEAGQLKLKKARVLCIGAGGLGSPAAYYLAAAGVGTLGIVDFDVVDRSNLQRQILHSDDRIGMLKTESAKLTLLKLNPDIQVIAHETRLTSANADELFSKYDIILDGCDNFPTRYLVNDGCVKHKKPNVHGSIYRFEGQVTVFWPGRGPCYRCLYPEPPPPEMAPSCAEAGVLGVLPGIIGALEANEVIKIILGKGSPLVGRLLTFDALDMRFRELKLRRDPKCAYCAEGKDFPGYTDYAFFCGV